MANLPNYLLSHRKRLALSQDEVAFLLGTIDGTRVSRYERSARIPGLETVLALEVILQRPAQELFAGLYRKTRKKVEARAKELLNQTGVSPPSQKISRKHQLLRRIINPEI
jgi:transcriptional regulator with XRE-family HTH domain